jgi:endo-alpha-1,4-polygalactosaminidase (GH114 family)
MLYLPLITPMKKKITFILMLSMALSCHKDTSSSNASGNKTDWWKPKAGLSFDWVLSPVSTADLFSTEVVDVDGFETSREVINSLHSQGKKVIAYVSVGTIEKRRPDSSLLSQEVIGKVYTEWPDEKWLDIRQIKKLKPWLRARLTMIQQKGFDAIEPDNLDGYSNDTGFPLTKADLKNYCDTLISMAHSMGLGIGQKNVPELSVEYSTRFDWALTEDAFYQGWENEMSPYIEKNKPVFATEYSDMISQQKFENEICPQAKAKMYTPLYKQRMLTKWSYFCP